MAWEREIEVCRDVARRAGELALRHAAKGVAREDKADDSPVTVADRECERLIVSELRAAFPGDGFLGEEGADHGRDDAAAAGSSTRSTGRATSCAACPPGATSSASRWTARWSSAPATWPRRASSTGRCAAQGAFVNERRVSVSTIDRRDRAIACLTAFDNIAASPFADRILDHLAGYWAVRSMGGCQDAILVHLRPRRGLVRDRGQALGPRAAQGPGRGGGGALLQLRRRQLDPRRQRRRSARPSSRRSCGSWGARRFARAPAEWTAAPPYENPVGGGRACRSSRTSCTSCRTCASGCSAAR